MPLTDQQLRQELLAFGENVPPITQRNRETLRARLEVLRGQPRSRTSVASPSRSRSSVTTASPSKSRTTASPSTRVASSPSRARNTASPSRGVVTNSPSRTRANVVSASARPSTRSKGSTALIELSDSESDVVSTEPSGTRSAGPNVRTRSSASRRILDSPTISTGTTTMTDDVEQSIARHRREIKQLLDLARDRTLATNSNPSGQQQTEGSVTPIRPNSSSSSVTKSRSSPPPSPSKDDHTREPPKSEQKQRKPSGSPVKESGKQLQSAGKKCWNLIKNILKAFIVGSFLVVGLTYLFQKSGDLFPSQKEIRCPVDNVTHCEDFRPVINAIRKQLQIRTGEVECGFRRKEDLLVPRAEVENYLDGKAMMYTGGENARWNAIVSYILNKPAKDVLMWDENDQQTNNTNRVVKLSTKDAVRSLTCQARKNINTTMRNLVLLILGSSGLLALAWFLRRRSREHHENQQTLETYIDKALDLLKEQYEKHLHDPQTEPWLTINQIQERLIPVQDRERLKTIWERVQKYISEKESNVRSASQLIHGQSSNVWQWIKSATTSPSKNSSSSPKKSYDDTYVYTPADVGLTECLKLRNFFPTNTEPDDREIDQVVDDVQNRCANIKRIEHIGIHSTFVYLKFSSKEASAQGYHLLNNWKYHDREIHVKYIRLSRYYEHFPEAQEASSTN